MEEIESLDKKYGPVLHMDTPERVSCFGYKAPLLRHRLRTHVFKVARFETILRGERMRADSDPLGTFRQSLAYRRVIFLVASFRLGGVLDISFADHGSLGCGLFRKWYWQEKSLSRTRSAAEFFSVPDLLTRSRPRRITVPIDKMYGLLELPDVKVSVKIPIDYFPKACGN